MRYRDAWIATGETDVGDSERQRWLSDHRVRRAAVDGLKWTTITTAAASARSFTATGLSNGTRYNFRVIAINGAGFGSPSSTVSAVPSSAGVQAVVDGGTGWGVPLSTATRYRTYSCPSDIAC